MNYLPSGWIWRHGFPSHVPAVYSRPREHERWRPVPQLQPRFHAARGDRIQRRRRETEAFTTWQTIILGLAGGCFSLITIGGNLIVIISFFLERTIRQPANYFIASLAVSDLLIGTVSMPLYTTYILSSKHWSMGETFCDLWLSVDYTACLCSIYTVFCITVDRFCSIKLPAKYRVWRTERKVAYFSHSISRSLLVRHWNSDVISKLFENRL